MAVTRADVARVAGVSPAVVSYVLNAGPRPVAAATRARVQAVIEELGYRPNAVARALQRGGTRSIGLIVPDLVNPFFAELARAVEDVLLDDGYVLLVGSADEEPAREAGYLRTFLERQVDAVLLISVQASPSIAPVVAAGVPVVVLDRMPDTDGISTVVVDGALGAVAAVEHLVGHGHRSIGCVSGPRHLTSAQQRRDGWARAMAAADLPAGEDLVVHEPFTLAGGHRAATRLLSGARRPDALFVATDVQALGVLSACSDLGVAVPGDLAVVSFDGSDAGRFSAPPLTSVAQPVGELARRAVTHLLAAVSAPHVPLVHETLSPSLVVRRSCGCRP